MASWKRFTDAQVTVIKDLWGKGAKVAQIAREIGEPEARTLAKIKGLKAAGKLKAQAYSVQGPKLPPITIPGEQAQAMARALNPSPIIRAIHAVLATAMPETDKLRVITLLSIQGTQQGTQQGETANGEGRSQP